MSVVGIDPSLTSTGIAVLGRDISGKPFTANVTALRSVGHRGTNAASWDERSDRIVSQTRFVVSLVPRDAELVVIEDLPSHVKLLPSFRDRCVLWGGIYAALKARNIPTAVCNPKTRAKWATGTGAAGKSEVLTAVRSSWPGLRVDNDDQADALTMAAMGALHLGWRLPFEIKPRHHAGLDAVAWPTSKIGAPA